MGDILFIVLLVVLGIMIFQNVKLFKRSKHVKEYVACSDAIFDDRDDKIEVIKAYIEKETDQEFRNKGRVLEIYADMMSGKDPSETLSVLDLKDTIYGNKDKFDAQKFEYNSDTYFWLILDLIKAHMINDKNTADGLVKAVDTYRDQIEQDLVVKLFYAIDDVFNGQGNMMFFRDLWNGNYPNGSTYDKRLIGFYKYIAVAILAYKGEELSEEMVQDVEGFTHMKAGKLVMNDLGIYDKYHKITDEDADEEPKAIEEVTEEASEETKEEAVEETSEEVKEEPKE